MRFPHLITLFVLALIISCKKDEQPEPTPPGPVTPATLSDYSKLAAGNWWVYSTQRYDAANNYTPVGIGRDTIRLLRDTVFHNDTFLIADGTFWGGTLTWREYWRDSADCIVNENGHILFCYDRFDQNLQHDSLSGYWTADHMVSGTEESVQCPSGTFTTRLMTITYDRGVWGITYNKYNYARGIGRVKSREDFPAQPGGLEMKLMSYHLQ